MNKKKGIADIEFLALKQAADMGYELVEAAIEKEGAGNYLRFYIDKEGGITLDDCEKFHMEIQSKVEQFEYDFLEVCSPGLDRPIKTQRDAQKAAGKQVEIKLYKPRDGKKVLSGIFTLLDEEGYHLMQGSQEVVIPSKEVALARPTLDFEGLEDTALEALEDELT